MSAADVMPADPRPVVIVGGGLAGLATAVGLAQHGVPATLVESRPRLGGRASSFQDAASGEWIDNCQHVTMGCCTNFRWFCEQTGLADRFRRETTLYFVGPDGTVNRFGASSLPAPLHLAGAFARLSYLTWGDKLALGRSLRVLARSTPSAAPQSMAEWLQDQCQPQRVIDRFWKVTLVSALSESLDRIDVAIARKVIVDGFLAHREAWLVDIPTAPLEELYGQTLTNWLQTRGVTLRLQTGAEGIDIAADGATQVRLKNGELLPASDVVLAVAHQRLGSLLPTGWTTSQVAPGIDQLEAAPISSVHLWFDRPITPLPHAVFVEGLVQWVFNRTALAAEGQSTSTANGYYYQVVISASRELQGRNSDDIRDEVVAELAKVLPETRSAKLLRSRQVTEHRAVFSPLPGSSALRPPQQTPIGNLQLAGDYTQTGWPATMEGAVRSGFLAAENVLRRRGVTAHLLQPDLPQARGFRWLFKAR